MKKLANYVFILLACGTVAAVLKMGIPSLSFCWKEWFHNSLRNKVGLPIGMVLYELYFLGWLYILALVCLILGHYFVLHKPIKQRAVVLLGLLAGMGIYLIYQLYYSLTAAHIYASHADGQLSKPWYSWVELPQSFELLLIYGFTGLVGGWLYYRQVLGASQPLAKQ